MAVLGLVLAGCSGLENDFDLEKPVEKKVDESGRVLETDTLKVTIPEGALEEKQRITMEEGKGYKKPNKDEAILLSAPVHLNCEQDIRRFNEPIIIEMALSNDDIDMIEELGGGVYGAYYDGKNWHYIKPLEVNLEEEYFTFETYHFSQYTKSIPSNRTKMQKFAKEIAVGEWSKGTENSAMVEETENLIKDIMKNKLGISDSSLRKDILTAVMNEDEFGSLMTSYENNDMDTFSQGLAVMTGKKIFEAIDDQSNKVTKALLGDITDNASKIGTGVKMAAAISEAIWKRQQRHYLPKSLMPIH